MSTVGDEFMVGAGFLPPKDYSRKPNEASTEQVNNPELVTIDENSNSFGRIQIHELISCAMQMVKNMPMVRDWYIRKYHFTDECDFSNYFAKHFK